jgi:hypothetical protein
MSGKQFLDDGELDDSTTAEFAVVREEGDDRFAVRRQVY